MSTTRTPSREMVADAAPVPRSSAGADLNLLRTFLAVYRAGTFTAAAPALGLSQPTVTAQIRALEKHTGRRLFERRARGVEPTTYARGLAVRVAEALDSLAAIDDESCSAGGRPAPVHLAGPSELMCTRVLPAIAPLVADGVQVRIQEGVTEQLLDGLREGQHDLVITTRRPRGGSLESFPLADEEYLLVASPRWADWLHEERGDQELCQGLRDVPLVSYADDMPIVRRYWRSVFGRQHPPIGPALTVPNLHDVVAAVARGAGYSVVPRSLCMEHLATGRLIALDDPCDGPLNTLFLVQRPGAGSNPATARVREALRTDALCWDTPLPTLKQ
ncbi:LysR family transcriptional regulator [Brachybacterium sp. FME24]|uniref:LysR family transcriptional regulator n=1 Tax=Brachybacterium sp. FME24 TaxID=2742605 RepID=UPI001D03063D|nr:LysR family transcriptional regulator [Brachybacterium sp. FME24]